ncbi:MAG: putative chromosome segregation DNA-binding protein [Rickettsiaceae bacterium]|jgi:ParB family chromosome partitioning protein|nr:putative chromosome segregation DNA-binding protein [Rickettsiaceae bacterium]
MKIDQAKIRMPENDERKAEKRSRVSVYTEDYRGEYYNLSVERLTPFKGQARKFFDEEAIDSLASTIKEHGIRQPLTVIPADNEGFFEIVSGERRFMAAVKIGLKQVPCIIMHDKVKAEEIALIENVQRKDLHPLELAEAYQNLLDKKICITMQEIATKIGLQKSSVVETLGLRTLPESTKELLIQNQIKSRDFFRILGKARPEEHKSLIKKFLEKKQEAKVARKTGKVLKIGQEKVLQIMLKNNEFVVAFESISCLTKPQKDALKVLLKNMISEF